MAKEDLIESLKAEVQVFSTSTYCMTEWFIERMKEGGEKEERRAEERVSRKMEQNGMDLKVLNGINSVSEFLL